MKKLSLILLAVCLILTAAGCTQGGEDALTTAPSQSGISAQDAADMNTSELLEEILSSSDALTLISGKTYRQGVIDCAQQSPAVAELLKRADNAEVLLKLYRETTPPTSAEAQKMEETEVLRIYALGVLLAQPEVTANMDDALRQELEEAVSDKEGALAGSVLGINTYRDAAEELAAQAQ